MPPGKRSVRHEKGADAGAVLILLFALALFNTHAITAKTRELSDCVSLAERASLGGDTDEAVSLVEEGLASWMRWSSYTHIMLRHSEIELVIEGFFDLLGELETEDGASHMDFERLRVILRGISDAERPRWGSVL